MNNVFIFYILGLIAQGLVAFFNYHSTKIILDINSIGLFLLKFFPIVIIYSLFFLLYFGIGSKYEKFGVLYIISITIGIFISLFIQYFLLKQGFNIHQIIGTSLIFVGIVILNYPKIIN